MHAVTGLFVPTNNKLQSPGPSLSVEGVCLVAAFMQFTSLFRSYTRCWIHSLRYLNLCNFMDWDAFNGGRINTGCEDSSVRSKLVASNPRLVTYFVSCSFLLILLKVKAKYMLYVCSQLHADTGLLFLLVTI